MWKQWKLWLWVPGRQLSQNAYFLCANVKSSFAVIGLVNDTANVPWNSLNPLLRNAFSSANFQIAHLGPWLSALASQRRLDFLECTMKKNYCENTYEWKLKIKVMCLWVRGRQLSQNAYFCVQNVKSSFAVIGRVNETVNVPWKYTLLLNFCKEMLLQAQTSKLPISVPGAVL